MAHDQQQVFKVGQLASSVGLTVRTLHHFDHLGLVSPSQRTHAGHRLYDSSDVERLYQVLALRQLGLPLEQIGEVLDGNTRLETLLRRHQDHVDRQVVAMRTLRAQLGTMVAALQRHDATDIDDFLELIRSVITVDDTVKKYFSEAQLADLAERREALGEKTIADGEASWQVLIPRVQQAIENGTDPTSVEAQEMARKWMELLHQFHGGDEGLRESLYQMYSDNADEIEQQYCGPSEAQLDFIKRANAARE